MGNKKNTFARKEIECIVSEQSQEESDVEDFIDEELPNQVVKKI